MNDTMEFVDPKARAAAAGDQRVTASLGTAPWSISCERGGAVPASRRPATPHRAAAAAGSGEGADAPLRGGDGVRKVPQQRAVCSLQGGGRRSGGRLGTRGRRRPRWGAGGAAGAGSSGRRRRRWGYRSVEAGGRSGVAGWRGRRGRVLIRDGGDDDGARRQGRPGGMLRTGWSRLSADCVWVRPWRRGGAAPEVAWCRGRRRRGRRGTEQSKKRRFGPGHRVWILRNITCFSCDYARAATYSYAYTQTPREVVIQ